MSLLIFTCIRKYLIWSLLFYGQALEHVNIPLSCLVMIQYILTGRQIRMSILIIAACGPYQGPVKRFPVLTVNNILKDVLTSYLQEEKYEAELCRQMTKTISEVRRMHTCLTRMHTCLQRTYMHTYIDRCIYIHMYCTFTHFFRQWDLLGQQH